MTSLPDCLAALQERPDNPRRKRQAVLEILSFVARNLRNRLDYETVQEIANDTANAILGKAAAGAEINTGVVIGTFRNLYRKHLERVTALKRQPIDKADLETEHVDAPLEHAEVRAALEALPESQLRVLYLRYWDDQPLRVCGERLSLSMQNVRTLERRGLEQLREALLA